MKVQSKDIIIHKVFDNIALVSKIENEGSKKFKVDISEIEGITKKDLKKFKKSNY
jgi:hypothetical protein